MNRLLELSTGQFQFNRFESTTHTNEKAPPKGCFFVGAGDRARLH